MEIIAIDIETIPHQGLPDECMPKFDPSSIKIGNCGPEKAKAKIDAAEKKWKKALTKKMSLDPTLCQVCTFVGVHYDTESQKSKSVSSYQVSEDIEAEYDCIYSAWDFIKKCKQEKIPLVTFSGINFDLPVLIFRAMALDIPIPQPKYYMQKYSSVYHYDLMEILAHWDKQRWNSLDFYLRLFGLGGKGAFDGSQVYQAWKAGEYAKIQDYCMSDVMSLIALFERVEPWIT